MPTARRNAENLRDALNEYSGTDYYDAVASQAPYQMSWMLLEYYAFGRDGCLIPVVVRPGRGRWVVVDLPGHLYGLYNGQIKYAPPPTHCRRIFSWMTSYPSP
jgi:hypothetical protein